MSITGNVGSTLDLNELLTDAGLLIPSGLPGLYARTLPFEVVAEALARFITVCGATDTPETLRFPPIIDQNILERNGYFIGFPHLAGCIHSFAGSVPDHKRLLYKLMSGAPVGDEFVPAGCALTPAACYPVYPLIAARGTLPEKGVLIDVESYCFRHEPSNDPARMQSFRMREYVRIGSAEQVKLFRDEWLARGGDMMNRLGLPWRIESANDPFFGTTGATLAAGQKADDRKFELLVPISSVAMPTAGMSFNYHETHFTAAWDLRGESNGLARSGCVAFGVERIVLALFAAHGPHLPTWPDPVRRTLWPLG